MVFNYLMSSILSDMQPWSDSVLQQVVTARESAWGEFRGGVTRSQKHRAIWRYFREAESYERWWPEMRGILNLHMNQIYDFLEDPFCGIGRESMTFEEYGARFQFGGDESEGAGVNEGDPAVVADLVPSVEAEVV